MNTKFSFRSAFTAIICTTSIVGCSSLSHKYDADRAKAVKKVAIVAIEIHQQQPTDNLGLSKINELKDGPNSKLSTFQTMTQKSAEHFIKQLRLQSGWDVLNIEQVKNNSSYKKQVAQSMSTNRTVMMGAQNFDQIYLNGFLDVMAFRKMTLLERDQLAKALGVDAVGELFISQSMEQSMFSIGHITGGGAFSLKARANLQLFGLNSDEPIWRSQNVDGELSQNSDSLPDGMNKMDRLATLGEEASISALSRVVQTLPK